MHHNHQVDESIRLIDAVHQNLDIVTDTCYSIEKMARDVVRLFPDLAEDLHDLIDPLMQSAAQVRASYNLDLNGQIRHGEAMIGGLFGVALKMADMEEAKEQA